MDKARLDRIAEIRLNSKARTKDKDKTKLTQKEINDLVLDIAKIMGLID